MAGKRNRNRPDQSGVHRGAFERNKKKIYATQTVCGICGKPVDWRNFRKIQAEAERNESKDISGPKQSENKEKAKLKQRVML